MIRRALGEAKFKRTDRPVPQDEDQWRSVAARDVDRLLYSTALRRLEGVTQVSPVGGHLINHNRFTHSLKVAQISQRIAERLLQTNSSLDRTLDPTIAFAAGLAHDLGHPPFGHVAEKELSKLVECSCVDRCGIEVVTCPSNQWYLRDSFEGNAQTFRTVVKLTVKEKHPSRDTADGFGLNLSYGTLAAIAKYPWRRGAHKSRLPDSGARWDDYYSGKWSAYDDDWRTLRDSLRHLPDTARSIESQVMDFADDLTYAIHDIEDYFRLGMIPLHNVTRGILGAGGAGRDEPDWEAFIRYARNALDLKKHIAFDEAEALQWIRAHLSVTPDRSFANRVTDRVNLHKFGSRLMDSALSGIHVRGHVLYVQPEIRWALELLKELPWFFVINHPSLSVSQQGQRRVVRDLFTWLCEWINESYVRDSGDREEMKKSRRNRERLPGRLLTLIELNLRPYDDEVTQAQWYRVISRSTIDFISALTDKQAHSLHGHLGGTTAEVQTVDWLQRV